MNRISFQSKIIICCRTYILIGVITFGNLIGTKKVVDIRNIDIQEAINTMQKEGRVSSSMRDALGRVRDCLEFAKHNRIISENPCFEISVPWENKQVLRRFLSVQEQNLFLQTVLTENLSKKSCNASRDKVS